MSWKNAATQTVKDVICIYLKASLGNDVHAVDQATLHHMILPALLTACEDAILQEWIEYAMYHFRICDAPINTKMFRHLLLDHIKLPCV